MKIIIITVILLLVWSVWGYFGSNVEQARYTVLKKTDGYEVREYAPRIVAQTTVSGSYQESLNEGFRIIAGYIFGGNVKKESVAMTAPVTTQKVVSEPVAMTAPVMTSREGESRVVSFVMPSSYTLATLPTPNDARVKLLEVPAQKFAVLSFSWFRSKSRVERMQRELRESLTKDTVEIVGSMQYAGYNAPWTPPWMIRNEVMVEIR
jgi:hypothetical protein